MKTPTQSHDEFVSKLNNLLAEIKKKAEIQFEYDLQTNVPNKRVTLDNAAEHGLYSGLVHAISTSYSWNQHRANLFAHHILEDSNCHTEARTLAKFIPEYQ